MEIKFVNVNLDYKSELLLIDINLTFTSGTFYGIYGKSGVGKTTLLKSILDPSLIKSGKILIDGQDTKTLSKKSFKKIKNEIAFLFQKPSLIDDLDVYSNIKYQLDSSYQNWFFKLFKILTEKQKTKLINILEEMGIADKIYTPCKFLSGGEAQRVVLSSLFFEPKKIIFADEPTTSLDRINAQKIFADLKKYTINNNAIVLSVIHDVENSLDSVEHVIFLKDKHVYLDKKINEINKDELLKAYL